MSNYKYVEDEIGHRFNIATHALRKQGAVPMLIVGCIIEEGRPLHGNLVAVNFQGRSPAEMVELLRSTAAELERQLQ